MTELPEELIVEILLRFPAKSLLRVRCVSKSLCALIDSPDFINSHLCKSSQNLNLRKMMIFKYQKEFHVYDVNEDSEEGILCLLNPVSFLRKRGYVYAACCNGLFLLFDVGLFSYGYAFTLWNPSTLQHRDLPHCGLGYDLSYFQYRKILGYGLGYDDSTDDYKAFYIVHFQGKLESKLEVQVWICGLKSNTWRRAQDFPYSDYTMNLVFSDFGKRSYFLNGSVHWLCRFNKNGIWKREIVSFDMRKETFSVVPLPVFSTHESIIKNLHVLGGCLCISRLSSSNNELYTRRKDGGDQFTWTQLYSVTESSLFDNKDFMFWAVNVEVLGYSKSRDKILHYFSTHGLLWYDLKKKSFSEVIEIEMDPNFCKDDMFQNAPIPSVESLVSVGRDS